MCFFYCLLLSQWKIRTPPLSLSLSVFLSVFFSDSQAEKRVAGRDRSAIAAAAQELVNEHLWTFYMNGSFFAALMSWLSLLNEI